MNLKLKKRLSEETHLSVPAGGSETEQPSGCTHSANVSVSCGIHGGRYPIGGMRIKDARQVLAKLMNIPNDAVPVINGNAIDEEQVIGEDVTMLSFVKRSSLKG